MKTIFSAFFLSFGIKRNIQRTNKLQNCLCSFSNIGNHQPAQSTFSLHIFSSISSSIHHRRQKYICHFESSLSMNVYHKDFKVYTLCCQKNRAFLLYRIVSIFLGHPVKGSTLLTAFSIAVMKYVYRSLNV